MAVAADSHRDFLIPEHTENGYARQQIYKYSDELRLFFCILYYITYFALFQCVLYFILKKHLRLKKIIIYDIIKKLRFKFFGREVSCEKEDNDRHTCPC
jgi:oligoendopeptidase F